MYQLKNNDQWLKEDVWPVLEELLKQRQQATELYWLENLDEFINKEIAIAEGDPKTIRKDAKYRITRMCIKGGMKKLRKGEPSV